MITYYYILANCFRRSQGFSVEILECTFPSTTSNSHLKPNSLVTLSRPSSHVMNLKSRNSSNTFSRSPSRLSPSQSCFKNQILATLRSRLALSIRSANRLVNKLGDKIGSRKDMLSTNGICASSFPVGNAKRLPLVCQSPVIVLLGSLTMRLVRMDASDLGIPIASL